MPERAEIAIMSDQVKSKILGKKINNLVILPKSRYWESPLFSSCEVQFEKHENYKICNIFSLVTLVSSRGKKIIIEFTTPSDKQFRMINACGMDGRFSYEQSKYTCLIFTFDDFYVYYDDVTNKGLFSLCSYPSIEYEHVFSQVGPDLMTDEVTHEIYKTIISKPRVRNMKIMKFMMEQKYMSGIGNWLRSDILYQCRINPHRQLFSLSEVDIYNLFYFSKATIFEAYQKNGLTIQDYLDPSGNKGIYECLCYGRTTDNHGYEIIKENDGSGRKITWCPSIQI